MACGGRTESRRQSPPLPPHRNVPRYRQRPHQPDRPTRSNSSRISTAASGQVRAADTTIADLQALYGKANVRVGDVPGPEGSTEQGVTLFPDDPARRAYVYFHDGKQPRRLASVQVFDPESGGNSNAACASACRSTRCASQWKPFRFGGLGWDYGGYVGRLERRHPRRTRRRSGDHRCAPGRAATRHRCNDDTYPIGEGVYSSDDPAWPQMGQALMVSQISVQFPARRRVTRG